MLITPNTFSVFLRFLRLITQSNKFMRFPKPQEVAA
jgi:hypothetical protein